jgi:hypothetical protein
MNSLKRNNCLLRVSIGEDAATATLEWELALDEQSDIFGDHDRLPTGNVLACSWPRTISPSATWQYDARAFEVGVARGRRRRLRRVVRCALLFGWRIHPEA